MVKIIFLLASFVFSIPTTSIYTLQVDALGAGTIDLSRFENKKLLLVNIASGDGTEKQLRELDSFYQQHRDSIIVIGFPSNSFGHEPHDSQSLFDLLAVHYSLHFPLAAPSQVVGEGANAVYQWLQDKNSNGAANAHVSGDFQKFLINRNGQLIGIFAPSVKLTDAEFTDAIIY